MPQMTKRQIEERLAELEAEIAIGECFDHPRAVAALKDEACGLAQSLASHDYRCEQLFRCERLQSPGKRCAASS
jgi:hypothetical protein